LIEGIVFAGVIALAFLSDKILGEDEKQVMLGLIKDKLGKSS